MVQLQHATQTVFAFQVGGQGDEVCECTCNCQPDDSENPSPTPAERKSPPSSHNHKHKSPPKYKSPPKHKSPPTGFEIGGCAVEALANIFYQMLKSVKNVVDDTDSGVQIASMEMILFPLRLLTLFLLIL